MPSAPLSVGSVVKITPRAISNRQAGQFSWHARVTATAGLGMTAQDLADAIQVATDAGWPSVLYPGAAGANCLVEQLSSITGHVLNYGQGTSSMPPGTVGTSQCPTQVSAVIKKITGIAGQRFRGRAFVPFVPRDYVDDNGELNSTGSAAYRALYLLLMTGTTWGVTDTVSLQPVVYHRSPLPPTYDDVAFFRVSNKLATQRRRGDYGTPNDIP